MRKSSAVLSPSGPSASRRAEQTDTDSRRPPRRPAGGFTLVELLVVIVIVGVVLSAATLSLRGDRRLELLQEEAERLHALTRLAREEAILRGEEIGVRFDTGGYGFLGLDGQRWVSLERDGVFRPRALPPELTLRLEVDGAEVYLEDREGTGGNRPLPHVVLWSSGEVTPFRAFLGLADRYEAGYRLDGRPAGTLALHALDEAG